MNEDNVDNSGANVSRRIGKEAQQSNFNAVKSIADIVKSTLGPKGMDKMLIDDYGEVIITNDGFKILTEMQVEHPAAKMVVEVAKTQEKEVGDGTTTSVIYTGELISKAEQLINDKVHPTIIIQGYQTALQATLNILKNKSFKISEKNFVKVAETSMNGKVAEKYKEELSQLVVSALSLVREKKNIPLNKIKIIKISGGSINESKIIEGIVLDKEVANINMPTSMKNPKILLLETPLEISELNNDTKFEITSPEQYELFIQREQEYLKGLVEKIKSIGANVVFCQKGIDDTVAYYLAKNNIMAVRRIKRSDMEKLTFALNIPIVSTIEDISKSNLGSSNSIIQRRIQNENYIFIEGCENPKAITILLKSSTIHILDEIERAIDDALGNIKVLIKNPLVVAGGGAIEFEIYKNLIKFAEQFVGKEQLAIKTFAESVLVVPKTLAENCGFDSLDIISKGIAKHNNGDNKCGVNSEKGIVKNVLDYNVFEPLDVKIQAFKSATEVASMLLRIDDIISSKKKNSTEM